MVFDETNNLLWFTSSNNSSIKYLDCNKRGIEKIAQQESVGAAINGS
jgi:hypothetical protein